MFKTRSPSELVMPSGRFDSLFNSRHEAFQDYADDQMLIREVTPHFFFRAENPTEFSDFMTNLRTFHGPSEIISPISSRNNQ